MQPNIKSHTRCIDIQIREGNGDRILTTVGIEIVRFQNDTVDVAMEVLENVFDGGWPSDLGSLIYGS